MATAGRPASTGHGRALTAEFSAPSAGPPPWHVSRVVAGTAHAVLNAPSGGATRWTF